MDNTKNYNGKAERGKVDINRQNSRHSEMKRLFSGMGLLVTSPTQNCLSKGNKRKSSWWAKRLGVAVAAFCNLIFDYPGGYNESCKGQGAAF